MNQIHYWLVRAFIWIIILGSMANLYNYAWA